jgi:hypothetical protein
MVIRPYKPILSYLLSMYLVCLSARRKCAREMGRAFFVSNEVAAVALVISALALGAQSSAPG